MSAEEKTKVTLHWLDRSRSQRILWLIYELDIPTKCDFKLQVYKRNKEFRAPPELKKVHQLGKSPVLEVQGPGQEKSLTIIESGCIVEYLCKYFGSQMIPNRYPEGKDDVLGTETEAWIRYYTLMQYAEGSFMSTLMIQFIILLVKEAKEAPFFIRPLTRAIGKQVEATFLTKELQGHYTFLESLLAKPIDNGDFFCGAISGVDVMLIFPVQAAIGKAGLDEKKYPKLVAWSKRCEEREAFKKSIQRIIDETGEFR